jgi:nitrite reductase/ring-hydroxylating ferredoxin subunit
LQSLCKLEEISPDTGKEVQIQMTDGSRYLALFLMDGEAKGYLNTCPHQGRSLNWAPDQFLLDKDKRLICPHHGACFDLKSGVCVSGPCEGASLTPIEIVVKDGQVYLAKKPN